MCQARPYRYIGERAVAVVLVEMASRLLAWWEAFEPPSVHQKNVQPAIVIIVVEATPQPVVSSRYLFFCTPPKIVFALKPASRAMFEKEMPSSSAFFDEPERGSP